MMSYQSTTSLPMLNFPNSSYARIERRKLSLLLALLLLIAFCGFFILEVLQLQKTMASLRANDVTRIELRNVLVDLLDAETGQRGYILTGDDRYLEPYYQAIGQVRTDLAMLQRHGSRDRQLMFAISPLAKTIEGKLSELERTISLRRAGNQQGALQIIIEGSGKAYMDQSRNILLSELNRLRAEKNDAMSLLDERAVRASIVFTLMLSAIVGLTSHAWRSLAYSARQMDELAKRYSLEASHDALTGLPNRRFFEEKANQLLQKCHREGKQFILLLLDLDGFKAVNDCLGHAVGDEVLKQAANQFQSELHSGDFLARLGGDEFAILIEGEYLDEEINYIGNRLIDCLSFAISSSLQPDTLGTSIGAARFPHDSADIAGLLHAADKSLYKSKKAGRNRVSISQQNKSR